MSRNPLITGIICTYNRERFLKRCIESLLTQSIESGLYEILVVDNGSTDRTREICDSFQHHPNFRYAHEPVLGLSSARDTGGRQAQGNFVGYLDDDAVAAQTWFEKALWSFAAVDPCPDWVGGPIELEWEIESPAWITPEHWVTLGYVHWGEQKRFLTAPGERLGGGNSFYPKLLLEKMNGFDTRLGRKQQQLLSGEETQFQQRLKALGGRLYYHPGVRIFHYVSVERTRPEFFYRRYYWGGITDYIMARTLKGTPSEIVSTTDAEGSRMARLSGNLFRSFGLFVNKEKAIQSRIYMSYVAGHLAAVLKYGWRKAEAGR